MIVKRFYDSKLAQTSYLIGCGRMGTAIVIDPNRDVEQYVRVAEAEGVKITDVTETHIHADFVSGARELAERTGEIGLFNYGHFDDFAVDIEELMFLRKILPFLVRGKSLVKYTVLGVL